MNRAILVVHRVLVGVCIVQGLQWTVMGAEAPSPTSLVQRIARGGAGSRNAQEALLALPSAESSIRQGLKSSSPSEQKRLWLALAAIPAAPDELIKAFKIFPPSAHRTQIMDALVNIRDPSIPYLLALKGDKVKIWEESLFLIGRINTKLAGETLINLCGEGTQDSRAAKVKALSLKTNRYPMIRNGLVLGVSNAKRADLWHALGLLAKRPNAPQNEIYTASAKALRTEKDYENQSRLLQILGRSHHEPSLRFLNEFIASFRTSTNANNIALRRISADALAQSHHPYASSVLSNLLIDLDPGVRIAATKALAEKDSGNQGIDDDLIRGLNDEWPEIQQLSAAALGNRCKRPSTKQVLLNLLPQQSPKTAMATISALTNCGATEILPTLYSVIEDESKEGALRIHAARKLDSFEKTSPAKTNALFIQMIRRSTSNEDSQKIAIILASILGTSADPDSTAALMDAAMDPAFPALQAAALKALSESCPPKAMSLFKRLQQGSDTMVQLAAKNAHLKCQSQLNSK